MALYSKLLAVLVLLGLAFGGYYALGSENPSYESGILLFSDDELELVDDPVSFEQLLDEAEEEEGGERVFVAINNRPGNPLVNRRETLVLTGRVVDRNGAGIEGAEVSLAFRQSFTVFRRGQGERARGNRTRGQALPEAFQRRKLGRVVKTKADGRFAFRGPAYARTTLEVEARHSSFAPALVRREWKVEEGELAIKDIVMDVGGTAFGIVLSKEGSPLENAEIRWQSSRDRGNRRERRGRRNRSRGGLWDTRRNLARLLLVVKSDGSGRFSMPHLPLGSFTLAIHKEEYLPGSTGTFTMETGARIDCGEIKIELGAELMGIVTDQQGQPIVGARVLGRMARRLRGGFGRGGFGQGGFEDAGRRGRRGARNGNGSNGKLQNSFALFRHESETETDDKGKFHLHGLPHGGLRVEVRHKSFIDEEREPVDPKKTPYVEFKMFRRLAIAGLVVDTSGKPIEVFGIRARRIGSGGSENNVRGGARGGNRGARGGNRGAQPRGTARQGQEQQVAKDPAARQREQQRQAEREKRAAERQLQRTQREQERKTRETLRIAERQREKAYRVSRLGTSGRVPHRPPEPEKHEGGKFLLEGLQAGEYVFDVGAPGFASMAAGPVKLERGKAVASLTVRMEAGAIMIGLVVDKKSGKPIAAANVELYIPALPTSGTVQARNSTRAGFGSRNFGQRGRGRGRERSERLRREEGLRVDRVRSDAEGRFVFQAQRPGTYQLVAENKEHLRKVLDNVILTIAKEQPIQRVALGRGSRVFGTVSGRSKEKRYQVVFVHEDGARRTAEVKSKDGSYEIKKLRPGAYNVNVEERRGRNDFSRRAASARLAQATKGNADIVLDDQSERRYDIDTSAADHGKVTGIVFMNGKPAQGYEVHLVAKQQPQAGQERGRGRRGGRGFSRNTLSDSSNREGVFEIDLVPPGAYTLAISPRSRGDRGDGRRGGRGGRGRSRRGGSSANLLTEELFVAAGTTLERQFQLTSASIEITVTDTKSGKPATGVRISLVPAAEAQGLDARQLRRLPSLRRITVRNGKAQANDFLLGDYVAFISGRGVKAKQQALRIGPGENRFFFSVEQEERAEGTRARQGADNRGRRRNGEQGQGRSRDRSGGRRR